MSDNVNYGIYTRDGGTTNIDGLTAVGPNASIHVSTGRLKEASAEDDVRADIGIISVLAEEAQAIRGVFGLEPDQAASPSVDVGKLRVGGRSVVVAATRALAQGEISAVSALGYLRERYNPRLTVLVGIAGGIHRDIFVTDVVIATRVVYYDLRKETSTGTIRRGQERQAAPQISYAVNQFFTDHGEPAQVVDTASGKTIRVLTGPIGSGNAVIADRDSNILQYLAAFNDKILAVDMEAGGLSQACDEQVEGTSASRGWLVIRGISDLAGSDKNDEYHFPAAWNAAVVLRELLSYLLPD